MWEHGCYKMAMGVLSLNWAGGTPTHPLLDAGSRRYMVLAAKRLAMLITIIRDRHAKNGLPPAAINLVAHSQGCMLSLLAHAFLADEKKLPVDCLIMNNPPFSLEESFVDGASQMKNAQQSTHARVTTLKDIVAFLTTSPATSPAFKTILDPLKNQLLTGQHPGKVKHPHTGQDHAFQDRDNRGRVFLYFCPKDLTVGFTSVQGIGWQGVPDRMTYTVDRLKREWDVLAALGDRFHQRVWTDLERDQAPPVLVGQAERSTYTLRDKKAKDGDFWGWAKSHGLRAVPGPGETRTLQAPTLPIPWKPNLAYGEKQGTAGFLEVSPIDAAVAVTNQGEKETTNLSTAETKDVRPKSKFVNDPRTPWERPGDVRGGSEGWLGSVDLEQVAARLNQGKEPRDCIEVLSAQAHGGNRLEITYRESFREAQERWMLQEVDANSYHSGIISNPDHSRRVTAYDLAIAPIYASTETEKMTKWVKENEDFLNYLRAVADWRKKTKIFTEVMNMKENAPFYKQEPTAHKALMEATAYYYWLGELPAGLKGSGKIKEGEWKIPSLVKCETVSEVSLHNAPFNGSRYQSQDKS